MFVVVCYVIKLENLVKKVGKLGKKVGNLVKKVGNLLKKSGKTWSKKGGNLGKKYFSLHITHHIKTLEILLDRIFQILGRN